MHVHYLCIHVHECTCVCMYIAHALILHVLVHACIVLVHALYSACICIYSTHTCMYSTHTCMYISYNICTLHVPAIIAGQSGLLWYSTDYERGHGNTLIVDCQSKDDYARFVCSM